MCLVTACAAGESASGDNDAGPERDISAFRVAEEARRGSPYPEEQWQRVLASAENVCRVEDPKFAAPIAADNGDTEQLRNVVRYLCPERMNEFFPPK